MSATTPAGPPEAPDLYVAYENADLPDVDEESREIEAPKYVRTERAPYASPPGELDAMWAAARASREAKKRRIEPGGEIVWIGLEPKPLPPAAKRLVVRLLEGDWEVDYRETCVEVSPALYLGRGKDGSHEPGDVKTPGHLEYRWSVHGGLIRRGQRLAWFWATWARNEALTKPGNSFEDAMTWDPVQGKVYEGTATGFEDWLSIFLPKA